MMNHGAPLLLNLQPGQTVQPLTLIQCKTSHQSLLIKRSDQIIDPSWLLTVPAAPSLRQLVRPSVGISPVLPQGQTRQGPTPLRGPTQTSSAFTAMQLPATLTIRTSTPGLGQSPCTGTSDENGADWLTDWSVFIYLFIFFPVNLQMTQVGGANSLKLAGSPALPSGSANGVTRTPSFSSSMGRSVISTGTNPSYQYLFDLTGCWGDGAHWSHYFTYNLYHTFC